MCVCGGYKSDNIINLAVVSNSSYFPGNLPCFYLEICTAIYNNNSIDYHKKLMIANLLLSYNGRSGLNNITDAKITSFTR